MQMVQQLEQCVVVKDMPYFLATATPPGQSNFCPLLFYARLANVVIMLSAREVEKSSSEMIAMENFVVESNISDL